MIRLKTIFKAAALGVSLQLLAGCASLGFASPLDDVLPADKDKAWSEVLKRHSTPFRPYAKPDNDNKESPQKRLPGQHATAVQLETNTGEIMGLLLSPYQSPLNIIMRHGESAAAITDRMAGKIANKNIKMHYMERGITWNDWIMNTQNPATQKVFKKTDVITLSMAVRKSGPQHRQCSGGNVDTWSEIRQADNFWKNTQAIFVWSAGNQGDDPRIKLERSDAYHLSRADTLLRIGEAEKDGDHVYIVNHSSRAGASFVTDHPFTGEFYFKYYAQGDALRKKINETYEETNPWWGGTNKDIFEQRLMLMLKGKTGPTQNEAADDQVCPSIAKQDHDFLLLACHPEFGRAAFPGKENLLKGQDFMRQNPGLVRKAFTECIVSAADFINKRSGADEGGYTTGHKGTSFSAPNSGGYIAGMRELHPELSEYDLVAAALIAAVPAKHVFRPGSVFYKDSYFEEISYQDNGRGLPHNSYEGGFGYLSAEAYKKAVTEMVQILKTNPDLKTEERRVSSKRTKFKPYNAIGPQPETFSYHLDIDEDITALRANLAIRFDKGAFGVPEQITLISPSGGKVILSPSKLDDKSMVYSLASTDGVFGNHTKGRWAIETSGGARITEAHIAIAGVKKGGLIDSYLEKETGPAKKAAYKKRRGGLTP